MINSEVELQEATAFLESHCHGRVARNQSLAPFTSYQLGGPASIFVEAETEDDLAAISIALQTHQLPVLVIGRGSNMLVSDLGFAGVAIRLGSGFRMAAVDRDRIRAGAAMPVPAVSGLALRASLAGFEFAIAIPASVGGAVAMNAGAHGHSTSEVLAEARVFNLEHGEARVIPREHLGFSYRRSELGRSNVVTEGLVQLSAGDPSEIERRMHEARAWRRATQPIGLPNAGSIFKNPPEEAAGSLVERIVGKGAAVGGARVSEVHANFIVTEPGAKAGDVYSLIRRIQREVEDNSGVKLETEVKLIGEFV
ncbi:MAG: UDP-N-acetylmuramate dehydrogenase [Actinomycetota bacterium]